MDDIITLSPESVATEDSKSGDEDGCQVDWGSLACLCFPVCGFIAVLGAVMTTLAFTLELKPDHFSLARYYGINTDIVGISLLVVGLVGLVFGFCFLCCGICSKIRVERKASVDSFTHLLSIDDFSTRKNYPRCNVSDQSPTHQFVIEVHRVSVL